MRANRKSDLSLKKGLQEKILRWYALHMRDLPWRKTRDPYAILVSEVMLQQTQVERVIPYYERFLREFPGVFALAGASREKLLLVWSGLGYNSRALRLQEAARVIADRHGGRVPEDEEGLRALPGVGPYTASAVLAFAFNKPGPVVDTNVRRVLIHELGLDETISFDELKGIALSLIPEGKSRVWHNALMDYGAMEKTSRKTGIASLSRQPAFEGSAREARGKIVRLLLKKRKILKKDLEREVPHAELGAILEKMRKEGIVALERGAVYLANG